MKNGTLENKASKNIYLRLLDPGHLFERTVRSWGAKDILHLETQLADTAYLPLERMVFLTGTVRGTLVLRASSEFGAWLRQQRSETPLGRYNEGELFEELLSLYSLCIFHHFWNSGDFQVGPIHPFRSIPVDWPEDRSHLSCSMLVEGHPVEIRLWLKD
jgi:hypothetical protein